jgi:hypothetical protein
MPGPIVTETTFFRVVLRQLPDCWAAALPKGGAKLITCYVLTRHWLVCNLLACRLLARRLLTHPWRRVVQLGPDRILVIFEVMIAVSCCNAVRSDSARFAP